MAHVDHGAEVGRLVEVLLGLEHGVEPARLGDALGLHEVLRAIAGQQVVVGHVPDPGPVLPGAFGQAVVAGQAVGHAAEVGRALDVVVAAEDIGPGTRDADIAEGELQHAVGAGVVVAVMVLGPAHAPDQRTGAVVRHGAGDPLDLRAGHAGYPLDLLGRPLRDLGPDLVHAPDPLADELLVLPAILEDVPEDAPDQGDVGAGAETHVFVGVGRGAGEARVADDQRCVVLLLGLEDVRQRHRMRLGGVAADEQHRARVVHVVVAVGHAAIAPGVRHTRDRGRMADPRLVVGVVGAPERDELAIEVRALVAVLGAAHPEDRVGAVGLADLEQLVANLVDRVRPGYPLVLPVDHLHRVLEAALAVAVLAHRCALGAVRAEIERAVEARLLADPDAVLDLGDHGAADRAMGAHGLDLL